MLCNPDMIRPCFSLNSQDALFIEVRRRVDIPYEAAG